MTKKETFKWIVQIIASIATAILTAMGTTSCMVLDEKSVLESHFPGRFVSQPHSIPFSGSAADNLLVTCLNAP